MRKSSASRPLIVLDALLVHSRPTGVGRSILELLPALAAKDRGLDFLVLATEPEMFADLKERPHWKILNCPGAKGGTLRKAIFTQWQVPRICRQQNAALLHSLQFVAPLRLTCPSVVTVHDLAWLRYPDTVEEPRRSYYRFFVPRTLHRANRIVTNSQATADDTKFYYPQLKAGIVPTLFGTPSWVWQAERGKRQATGPPYFLFVGTLEPRKNLEGLLGAYRLFLDKMTQAAVPVENIPRMLFIGAKGWKDSRLQAYMEPLIASGQLEVRNYCDTEQLWQHYRSAQALLFPSLHEGFGFPILEAMAANLPVLTSHRGAMAEVGGGHVLAVNPDNHEEMALGMVRLATDESLRKTMASAGESWAQKWTWARTADLTTGVYREILESRPIK